MQGALAWRVSLFAVLLFVSRADFSNDLKGDHSEDSRTGYYSGIESDSNESGSDAEAQAFAEALAEAAYSNAETILDDSRRDNLMNVQYKSDISFENVNLQNRIQGQENLEPGFGAGLLPIKKEYHSLNMNDIKSADFTQDDIAAIGNQQVEPEIPGAPVFRDDLVFPMDPKNEVQENENQYPFNAGKDELKQSMRLVRHKMISRLIPVEEHILLHKIPGAYNAIRCSKEGELHNFWAPSFKCMVCVCLSAYGRLRPVCVSCSSCDGVPEPAPTTPEPIKPPVPYTTPAPEEKAACKPLPVNVPFQSPLDPCKICVCTENFNLSGKVDVQINCRHNPQCVLPSTSPRTTVSTPVPLPVCDGFPHNVPFPHPHDQCKICKCTVRKTTHGLPEQQISCFPNPECQPETETPGTETETPVTVLPPAPEICDRYPANVMFPHPKDSCQVCKCTLQMKLFHDRKKITCHVKSNCLPTSTPPRPSSTLIPFTTQSPDPTPGPPPENAKCSPLPIGTLFQNPLNPCQVCICTESLNFGQLDVQIECQENPQCVIPNDATTLLPDIITPMLLPACNQFPENVSFPHPHDTCKMCKCSVLVTPSGVSEQHINCYTKPECLPKSTTLPPVTTPEPEQDEICGAYPINTPFDNPLDPCQKCVCTYGTTSLSLSPLSPHIQPHQVHMQCHEKPECMLTPEPITAQPEPSDICDTLPMNTPFDDPMNPCRECTCTYAATAPLSPNLPLTPHIRPLKHIKCHEKLECIPTPEPITDQPNPNEICGSYPVNTKFDNPHNPCQVCTCSYNSQPQPSPQLLLSPQVLPPMQIQCQLKPHCYPPSPEPYTEAPKPTPAPQTVSCKPLPVGTPFQNPMNPCQVCVCMESMDSFGRPDVNIKCQENPQCVLPFDVTTVPPTPDTSPIPLPACAQFPTNVEFPHPQDTCLLCKCTVEANSMGIAEQLITCHKRPECVPWPPAPPGPLPGPYPHESCDPYQPNKPFQHPWDECQACVCRESISSERITIEINCYTKTSCCIEPPFDVPGIGPVSNSASLMTPSGENWIGPDGGKLISPSSGNMINPSDGNMINPSGESGIKPTGGNLIIPSDENWIGTNTGNLISPSNENWIRPNGGNIIIPSSENWVEQSGTNIISPSGGNMIIPSGERWIGPTAGNLIDVEVDNVNANMFRPTGEKWFVPPGQNVYYKPSGENWITGRSIIESGQNSIRPSNKHYIGPTGGNIYESSGGIAIDELAINGQAGTRGSLHLPILNLPKLSQNLGSSLYLPNRGNIIHKKPLVSLVGNSQWREIINTKPVHLPVHVWHQQDALKTTVEDANGMALNAAASASASASASTAVHHHHRYSTKMRTKSGNPNDNDSSPEDEKLEDKLDDSKPTTRL